MRSTLNSSLCCNTMNTSSILIMIMALVGFFLLAAILLVPVYLFLKREKKASEQWTPEAVARRIRESPPSTNGASHHNATGEKKTGA